MATILSISACTNSSENSGNKTGNDSTKASNDRASGIAAIEKADSDWSKASQSHSPEQWLSFYGDDAIMMPPNGNVCKDKASREASIKEMFATPGMSLAFQTTKADVSSSGDLGYAVGVYQWASKDPKGNDYHETGKYCETWKKQSDGSWKCIVDIWNADAPATK